MFEEEYNLDLYGMFSSPRFGVIIRETIRNSQNTIIDMRIVYVNDYFKSFLKSPKTEALGKTLDDLFHNIDEKNAVLSEFSRIVKSGESKTVETFVSFFNKFFKIFSYSPKSDYVVSIYEDITHRKQLEQHLENWHDKSHHLTDCMDEVFWVRNGDRILYVNTAYEKIIGLPCSLFYLDLYSILTVVNSEDYNRVSTILKNDGANMEACYNIEFRIDTKSGSSRWMWLRTFLIRDNCHNSPKKAASIIDITEQKRLDEELTKNNRQITTLLEFFKKSSQHVELEDILLSAQKIIKEHLKINSMAIFMFDEISNSFILRSCLNLNNDIIGKISRIPMGEGITTQAYMTRKPLMKKVDDKVKALNSFFIENIHSIGCFPIVYDENVLGVLKLYIDKEALQYFEEELVSAVCNQLAVLMNNALLYKELRDELERRKTAEQEIELIFNTAIDFLAIMEPDGNLIRISPEWCKSLGWDESEILACNIKHLIHPDDSEKNHRLIGSMFEKGMVVGHETRILCKDGSYKWIAWNAQMVMEKNKSLVIAIGRDITRNKEIEAKNRELEKAMQMEAVKMEFFANISHEFRTPLNIIISALQLMQQSLNDRSADVLHQKAARHLKSIKQNSFRLLRLVNNLIDITKLDTGYFKIYRHNSDIVSTIENIAQSVAQYIEGKGLNLIFDTDIEEKIIACDTEMIERIMLNLLSNAVKFTEKGGYIKVIIKDMKTRVRILVCDTGIGISDDKLDAIFERFVQEDKQLTRRCEGSGIGLSLVKSMVELHEGKIWVSSTLGKGSDFIFELPAKTLDEEYDYHKNLEPTHEERIHKINVEFSDIYSLNN